MNEMTVTPVQDEADWAYKWGQEARARAEMDYRLNSIVYDAGLFLDRIQKFLLALEEDDEDKLEKLPGIVDQMLDLEDNIRNHMMRPVGAFAENERIVELCKRQIDGISTHAEDKEVDGLIDELLKTCNKKVLDDIRDWLEAEGGQNRVERREAHRSNWVMKCPKMFGQLAINRNPDSELVRKTIEKVLKKIAERSAES